MREWLQCRAVQCIFYASYNDLKCITYTLPCSHTNQETKWLSDWCNVPLAVSQQNNHEAHDRYLTIIQLNQPTLMNTFGFCIIIQWSLSHPTLKPSTRICAGIYLRACFVSLSLCLLMCARVVVCSVYIFDFRFDSCFWLLWILMPHSLAHRFTYSTLNSKRCCHNYTRKTFISFLQIYSILIRWVCIFCAYKSLEKLFSSPCLASFFLSFVSSTPWIIKNTPAKQNNRLNKL